MIDFLILQEIKLLSIFAVSFFVYLVIREVLAHENQR